jgi:hypothetical protein
MKTIHVLITISDTGRITVDVRGPVDGKEGMLQILESARELVEQGNFGTGPKRTQR